MTADSARRPASVAPVAGGVPAPLGPGGDVASAATPSMKLGSTGVVHTSATSRRGPRGRSARACPARRSGRLPLDRGGDGSLGAGDGQERVRQQRQGDMPIPAWPAADLIVVQADLAFGALEALLDRPADPGHADQPDQGRASRAKQVQKASTPSERLRRTSSQRTSAAALGAVNTTRIQSYSRRPLTPWPGYRSPLLSRRTDGQLLGRGPRRPLCWPQQLGALDGQHIAQAAVLQEAPQRLVAAVGLVGGDPAGWDLGI